MNVEICVVESFPKSIDKVGGFELSDWSDIELVIISPTLKNGPSQLSENMRTTKFLVNINK